MFPSKAPFITAEIERRIRLGFYQEKLPANDRLRNEFLVARQTLTDALKPLFARGLLSCASPRDGVRIHPGNLTRGVIAVVSGYNYSPDEKNLILDIHQDGFSALKIRKTGNDPGPLLLPETPDGVMFINSSLDRETAQFLRERKIPFISCNLIPFLPGIPYIDFDNPALYDQLLTMLGKKGYKRIAFFHNSRLEGYNALAARQIRRLKKLHGLPVEPYDRIVIPPGTPAAEALKKYVALCRARDSFPEVLISDFDVSRQFRQICAETGAGDPVRRLLYRRSRSAPPPESENVCTYYSLEMPWRLWVQGYRLLREIIFGRDPKSVHQLVLRRIAFDREIPEARCLR
ncbi:MAG: hypothetical protein IJU70_10415 [Lentisphaeria bacterium]|nr:hypothetical protein [Lentisphaeria bacterium]